MTYNSQRGLRKIYPACVSAKASAAMTAPSPLPSPGEIEECPQPVAVPAAPTQPRKPGAALIAGLCLVASLATAAAMWALAGRDIDAASGAGADVPVRIGVASAGELLKSLRAGGTIGTLNFSAIRAPRLRGPRDSGRADLTLMRLAEAGSIVGAGDIVAEFELKWLEDHIEDRESILNREVANLKKRQSEVLILEETERQARATAKAEFEKSRLDLQTAEVRSKIEAEVLANVSQEARATWRQLEDEGKIKEAVHAADIRIQELKVRADELHVERHERDLVRLQVKSPIQGMIVRESMFNKSGQFAQTKEGDQVYPGALFMRVVDVSQMVVNATVNQVDAQSIRIGDEALVELDAYPGERFGGRVVSVGAMASSGSAGMRFSRGSRDAFVKHIPMRILIDDHDERILPDLSASADVRASHRPTGVLMPREALRISDGDRSTYVYVHREGRFRRRDVRLEDVSDTMAMVGAGLQAGEEILLSGMPSGTEGYQ